MTATKREVARFGVVGILATLTHGAVLTLLMELLVTNPLVANSIAFSLALLVSYYGHHRWTFRSQRGHHETFWKFALLAIAGFLANNLIMELTANRLGWHYLIGFTIIVFSVPPITYILSRAFIFATKAD